MKTHGKLTVYEIVLSGILGGLTFALKVMMAWLPNIEPVSLMIMLFAVTFGWKAVFPIYVYVGLEFLVYGLSLWSVPYVYIWLILAAAAWCFRNITDRLLWAIISGTYGLLFGLLCTPVCIVTGGIVYAFNWWVAGIPYDILHCAGNFVIGFALFPQLRKLMARLYKAAGRGL